MNIEFAAGESGFQEACALLALTHLAAAGDPASSAEIQLLDVLVSAAERHRARPEFRELRLRHEARSARLRGAEESWWRALLGPTRREILLSEQRGAALERAARAERSSFEAVAETARIARERDELKARVHELEAALAAR
jgi:hypothetical protein